MLPSRTRGRYFIFILFSLLVHITVIMAVLLQFSDDVKQIDKERTIKIKLHEKAKAEIKQPKNSEPKKSEPKKSEPKKLEPKKLEPKKLEPKKLEPKKSEPKKLEPKKSEPKKSEPKKSEPKKSEPKKSEPKKSEPKKSEPKKSEPKKSEPKKSEPKKSEPKKSEPKKLEPKKLEPKKSEPKKSEPKKSEPKKSEPKKSEPKKSEPKKSQPKKSEPKKSEPKKSEPKKSEPKKSEPKKLEPSKLAQYQSSVDLLQQEKQKTQDALRDKHVLPKFGSMTMLDDRELEQSVIYTQGYGRKFKQREIAGQKIKRSLSQLEQQILNNHLAGQAQYIFTFFESPKKDGRSYYGEISILLDEDGVISYVTLKRPSGNRELDEAVLKTVTRAKKLKLPSDPNIRRAMVIHPLTLNYSDEDMAN